MLQLSDAIFSSCVAGLQEMLRAALQATMSKPVMPIIITEYTVDPAEAQPPVEVAPGVACAIQAPDVAPPPQLVGARLLAG